MNQLELMDEVVNNLKKRLKAKKYNFKLLRIPYLDFNRIDEILLSKKLNIF